MKTLTLVLPAFNEEGNIATTVEAACGTLAQVALEWEIIIVNDGSADGTGEICDQLTSSNRRVRVVHHVTNRGYGAALKSGIISARNLPKESRTSDSTRSAASTRRCSSAR